MDKTLQGTHTETVFELIQLDDRPVPVDADLNYNAQQPHSVRLTLALAGSDPVTWLIGRGLLADGLTTRTGDGDIRLMPLSEDAALLELRSTEMQAWFRIPTREIAEFLADTYEVVPRNRESEWLDLDSALIKLIAEGTALGDGKRKDR
jgi:hypothetical protein